ncbi:MAG: hypothetical protein CO127_01625 [Ignavibacteria bacterium CG_4_9_14_3_um_filter_36_18]|nr:MAG: hypothetical protein CO127_01625 [Ignavibacteria bacterium CG_4_9_14_3_um_filter_36_18]
MAAKTTGQNLRPTFFTISNLNKKTFASFRFFFYKFAATIFMGAVMVLDNKNTNCHFRGNGGKKL